MRSMWQRISTAVRDERGAATAEYAIVIMAAVGFAGLLVVILRSGEVQAILTDLVQRALNSAG
jgi:Flp pilus assembly pilin Flp